MDQITVRRVKKQASGLASEAIVSQHVNASLAMLSLYQMKAHSITVYRENARLMFLVRRASPTHSKSLRMKESALERSSLNLRLHLKLGGLCVGQTQHCTFSTDLLVHSRNRIDHFRERSSHPSRALSPPSQHRLQQDA